MSVAVTSVAAFCLSGTIRHSIPPQTMAAIQLRPEIKHNLAAKCFAKYYQKKATASVALQGFEHYLGKPVEFIEQELNIVLTIEQKEICQSVINNRETNAQAAHAVGKTLNAACLVLYWVFVEHGLAISTAPTKRQVIELLWAEVRRLYDRHQTKFGGERGQTFLRLTEDARAFGFTASLAVGSDAFQGLHHEKLLVIEDEAGGIHPEIDEGAVSCATGSKNRILRIGNPIVPGTPFEKSCRIQHIRIPVWNHPNVAWAYQADSDGMHRLKPEIAAKILDANNKVLPQTQWPADCPRDKIPGAISIEWIEDKRHTKGENSAFWQSRIEGLFPEDAANAIVPRTWFHLAKQRYQKDPEFWQSEAYKQGYRMGVDVGDGQDDTVIAIWQGAVLTDIEIVPTKGDRMDVQRAIDKTWYWAQKYGYEKPVTIAVDQIGVGAGVVSGLMVLAQNAGIMTRATIVGVNFGAKAEGFDDTFIASNAKSEQYWALREGFRHEEIAIASLPLEAEERLCEELAGIYYEELPSGKTKIEDKSKTRQRLKHSPDVADAVVMGYSAKLLANQKAPTLNDYLAAW